MPLKQWLCGSYTSLPMLLKNSFLRKWSQRLTLSLALLISYSQSSLANTDNATKVIESIPYFTCWEKTITVSQSENNADLAATQNDPIGSPHPIPWNWIMNTHSEFSQKGERNLRYCRTPSLISPDGQFAAYSRIQMQVEPELFHSRVTSVMFLENLQTGDLQTLNSLSILSNNSEEEIVAPPGEIAILIPISWSEDGDRLLSRQFEGIFSTSDASDSAAIWERENNSTIVLSPAPASHTHAVLLGWSQTNPERVLFRAGIIGEEEWPVLSVDLNGETNLATFDRPTIYGSRVKQVDR
ncbi:MAG: hypothetical protein QNJ54_08075 [Prochloraceae cyanobacterium]|nr:hypothetical protein [Prochloraceae cyanobacterium]